MISIVIPAHNEAGVIARCLSTLLDGAQPDELEVWVVCNGCTDATAEIARSFGDPVRVIDTEVASKNNALNLGDAAASGFPRFFLDADIGLPIESVRTTAEVLRTGPYLAAAPRLRANLADVSWAVRAYHEIWLQLPYVNETMVGSGVYAVSEVGRTRFDKWPDIIADDCMVRLTFSEGERCSVEDAWFEMTPPRTLGSLIHINVRRRVGIFEMSERHPELMQQEQGRQRRAVLGLAARPSLWPGLAVYAYAKVATVLIYWIRARQNRHKEWNRDDSSRGVA